MMSLFDLQDVRIAVGSLATLDLPMVVDLIGIYVLKGPYCTLTTTNCLHIHTHGRPSYSADHTRHRRPPPRAAASCRTCSGHRDEEFLSVLNPSSLLVQIDGGRLNPVVHLIGGSTAAYREEPDFPCEFLVGARRLDASKVSLIVPASTSWSWLAYSTVLSIHISRSDQRPLVVAKDPIAMHTSWRSNSDIASVTSIGYPRMSASGESSTTMHRLLHASGSHPIPPPNDPRPATTQNSAPDWRKAAANVAQRVAGSSNKRRPEFAGHGQPFVAHPVRNGVLLITLLATRSWLRSVSRGNRNFTVGGGRLRQSGPRPETISLLSACTRRLMDFITNGFSSKSWPEQIPAREAAAAATSGGGGVRRGREATAFRARVRV
ncbi:hypothetical protein F511_12947 [Dorcoceras hygrometricum]|uniref:Uncharacterized protein n=1 Tax=Dorcoceras hygrometricum TaxID=472368 RepID=A0A2Z7BN52_9LAMI|nr:hypothetical protein F511_12947 [Dorcoceras hygrometricum]